MSVHLTKHKFVLKVDLLIKVTLTNIVKLQKEKALKSETDICL